MNILEITPAELTRLKIVETINQSRGKSVTLNWDELNERQRMYLICIVANNNFRTVQLALDEKGIDLK